MHVTLSLKTVADVSDEYVWHHVTEPQEGPMSQFLLLRVTRESIFLVNPMKGSK